MTAPGLRKDDRVSSSAEADRGRTLLRVRYQVLGPLAATIDDRTVNLGGPKQRLVLGLLLVDAGRTVSADRLIDRIWDDAPPDGARHTLQAYISELRKLLDDPIEWTGNAYRLMVGVDQIDSARFVSLLEGARQRLDSAPEEAASQLREALALWRGRPYEDLDNAPGVRPEIARLEELRLVALESRIEADLRLGRQSEVLAELDSLTAEYPLREKFRAQQMLALYRAGRQAEALRAFGRLRQTLAEELGIDPSPELQNLEEQLLAQDPTLDLPAATERELVFLFTDLEGSTALWEIHADDMNAAVSEHHAAVDAAIASGGGSVFKTTGDGVLAVMPAVGAAVEAATQIQRHLTGRRWGAIEELSTRVAIDLGPARMRDGDYFGPTLNRCARILGVAHGGQVVLSASAAQAAPLTADTRVLDLGERRLKGIGSPQRIFQAVAPGLLSSFPPLRSDGSSRVISTVGFEATTIRGYELRDRIGEGDFGVVYRAYQTSVGREVAIKVIRPEYSNRPAFVRKFEAEAQFVAELEHPHIVSLYDYWRDPDGAYLVMPYMRGASLAQALRRGPWNAGPALRLLDQVGAALSYAHRKGVIHRDLKPANVLLDEDGNAYLSDFGISAHLTDKAGAPLTSSLTYVPPEELRGEQLTPESDIFSFAVLAFELFTGIKPTGRGGLPSISAIRPDLPVELANALQSATDDQPTKRPDRVEDFLRAVRQAIGADVVGVVIEDAGPSSYAPIRNPYKGLRAFQETDAADFHGREGLMDELLEAVLHHRLVAVVGPSGGGKSSVVRAGLLPALRAGALPESRGWLITDMFPGSYPFEELEAALLRVAVDDPGALLDELRSDDRGLMRIIKRILPTDDTQLVLVIDQFEEMFSMVDDEETRNLFLGALTTLVNDERGRVRVIITLRADFFDRPLQYSSFGQLVKDGLVPVIPPTDEGLSLAISRPARGVGLDLEPGLVGEIVNDVHGQPGGLPLLQYALTELFQRRQGSVLTSAGYRQTGGVLGALGRRAEETFSGLSPVAQEAAHQLFLRLVTVDEDTDDTRRRVRQSELRGLDVDQAALDTVIQQYASYRLLTFDRDPLTRSPTVEVAHEALLRGWDRLRGWIEEQRDELVLHRRLAAAQHEWEQADEGAAFLLAGGRLEQFESWAKDSGMSLTGAERQYLATSRVDEDRRVRRRTVRRWSIVGVLAAATVVIGLLALTANDQARLATVRELSAASIAKIEAEPELAILLALQAAETSRSAGEPVLPETLDALHRAVQASRIATRIPGSWFVEYSPNGELMAVASGSDAAIWNVAREEMIPLLPSPGGEAGGAAFSPDGSLLAVGYTGGEAALVLWDVATGERLSQMRGPMWSFPIRVAFSPDVSLVAAAGACCFPAFVWNVADGSERYQIGTDPTDAADVAFAPDGSTLAVADWERGVTLHDPETGAETDFIEDTDFNPVGIAFDPSGSRLAVIQQPGQEARIFDVDTQELIISISIQSPAAHAWSPDGRWLALVSVAGNPRLYDTETWNEVMVLPGPSSAWLAFSPDGRQLASASTGWTGEGDTLVWDVTPAGNREVRTLHLPDLSPDVAMFGSGVDEILVARDVCPPTCPATLGGPATQLSRGPVALIDASGQQIVEGPLAFVNWPLAASSKAGLLGITDSECVGEILDTGTLEPAYDLPAGMYAKALSLDGTRGLLDLIGPECPAEYTQPIVVEYPSGRLLARLPGGSVEDAYLSPDGQLAVATPYDTGKTYLYDIEAGQVLLTFDSEYFVFAFSPDGQQLAATATDGALTVFDVATLRAGGSEGQGLVWSIAAHVVIIPYVQYTPDGSAIVTAGRNDSLVRVWDPATGERIAEFATERDAERLPFIDISSDGRHMIALGGDDTLRVYTLDTDELIQIAKDRVTRSFTEEECRAYLHLETCPA